MTPLLLNIPSKIISLVSLSTLLIKLVPYSTFFLGCIFFWQIMACTKYNFKSSLSSVRSAVHSSKRQNPKSECTWVAGNPSSVASQQFRPLPQRNHGLQKVLTDDKYLLIQGCFVDFMVWSQLLDLDGPHALYRLSEKA